MAPLADIRHSRACDHCRARKIRCDRQVPCSNCRISSRDCILSDSLYRPKEHRQRVLISEQYEKKIDLIEKRLTSIESLLRQALPHSDATKPLDQSLSSSIDSSSAKDRYGTGQRHDVAKRSATGSEQIESETVAAAANTIFANEFLEAANVRMPYKTTDPNILAALGNLHQLVSFKNPKVASHEVRFKNQTIMPPGGYSTLPMPPATVIMECAKLPNSPELPSVFMFACNGIISAESFAEKCTNFLNAREKISLADMITINCGLYYILTEKSHVCPVRCVQEELKGHLVQCQRNLDILIGNLPLFLPADLEMVRALALSAVYATESSRMSLAWQLTVAGAQLAQTLGYHRISRTSPSEAICDTTDENLLFWNLFMFDKSLALRLGRGSTINTSDITIPHYIQSSTMSRTMVDIINMWVSHAIVLDKVYQDLYSTQAQLRPPAQVRQSAIGLANEIKGIINRCLSINRDMLANATTPDLDIIVSVNAKISEVTLIASLTLVYRAMPVDNESTGRFYPAAITTARETLQIHLQCLDMIQGYDSIMVIYVHWAVMSMPFAPFFVLVSHVIESLQTDDVELLTMFVSTLDLVSTFSEAIKKLHSLCRLMLNIAKLYLKAKTEQQDDHSLSYIGDEFEVYLSQLGLMPTDPTQEALAVQDSNDPFAVTGSSQLGDWYLGNQYMMGLLEDGLPDFDPMDGMDGA